MIDLRDRYGITQLVLDQDRSDVILLEKIRELGRECVIRVKGTVIERSSENPNLAIGAVEVLVNESITNTAELPPFTIGSN